MMRPEDIPSHRRTHRPRRVSIRRGDAASELEAAIGRPVWPWLFLLAAILYEDEWDRDRGRDYRLRLGAEEPEVVGGWSEPEGFAILRTTVETYPIVWSGWDWVGETSMG